MSSTKKFLRAEDGWASALGLYMTVAILMIGGIAVDFANGTRKLAHLQAAADAVALAAAQELPDTGKAQTEGLAIANLYFPEADDNDAIRASDIVFGRYNRMTGDLEIGGSPTNAVYVSSARNNSRGNVLPTYLMHFVGVSFLEPEAQSIALAQADTSCRNGGFFSDQEIISGSNNDYMNGFCLYGKDKVKIGSDNSFETGVGVFMENQNSLEQGGNNAGIDDALGEDTFPVPLADLADDIVAGMQAGSFADMPSYITNGPVYREKIEPDDTLLPNTLYIVNEVADFGSDATIENIAVVAVKEVKIGSNNTVRNIVFASMDKVLIGSNNTFGHLNPCTSGEYSTYLFSGSNIEMGSNNSLRGVQMGAQGEVKLGSDVGALSDVHAEAWGNFDYGSADSFSGCASGLYSNFGISPLRESEDFIKWSLVR